MNRYLLFLLFALNVPGAVLASSVIIQVLPVNLSSVPLSVRVVDADFGKRFTVFHPTNDYTRDEFIQGQLAVADADNQITFCALEKHWTTNGIQFEFTVADTHLFASKFTLNEPAHAGPMQMPGITQHWFYLRDFATNTLAHAQTTANTIPPKLLRKLAARIQALPAGIGPEEIWQRLQLAPYKNNMGSSAEPGHEHYWLSWNYELDLFFEPSTGAGADIKPKLAYAVLYKNGMEAGRSGKK